MRMKCRSLSKDLIAYLDRRANSAERRVVEEHLAECSACRERAEEFRKVWGVLDAMPVIEPTLGFDARMRQKIAAEPHGGVLGWLTAQPRLAFSMAMLALLSFGIAKWNANPTVAPAPVAAVQQQEDFNAIKDLGVLENYDVVTKMDALSQLAPVSEPVKEAPVTDSDGGA